jgi:hypothetical protein
VKKQQQCSTTKYHMLVTLWGVKVEQLNDEIDEIWQRFNNQWPILLVTTWWTESESWPSSFKSHSQPWTVLKNTSLFLFINITSSHKQSFLVKTQKSKRAIWNPVVIENPAAKHDGKRASTVHRHSSWYWRIRSWILFGHPQFIESKSSKLEKSSWSKSTCYYTWHWPVHQQQQPFVNKPCRIRFEPNFKSWFQYQRIYRRIRIVYRRLDWTSRRKYDDLISYRLILSHVHTLTGDGTSIKTASKS